MSEEMKEAAEQLPEEIKRRADAVLDLDKEMVAQIVHVSFIAGMQLCMRLCRNRAEDIRAVGKMMTMAGNEADNCAGIIRLTQVEIGSGRMARPTFTKEELEEMDQIS
jgi:hypothetical protein